MITNTRTQSSNAALSFSKADMNSGVAHIMRIDKQ